MSPANLPKYESGIAAALLGAREAVMLPLRPILRAHNLTEQQWRLLRVLENHGAMETMQISKRAMLFAPSVTRILKELTERKLVKRTPVEGDARRSLVEITDKGNDLVYATANDTKVVLDRIYSEFGAERVDLLIKELLEFKKVIGE